ncbi:hypothetical protein ACVBCQ_005087, partial [Escherichia albertii]
YSAPHKAPFSSRLTQVNEIGSAELQRVAVGMEANAAAIYEAISSRWSNGVVESHVNQLKMLKRQTNLQEGTATEIVAMSAITINLCNTCYIYTSII